MLSIRTKEITTSDQRIATIEYDTEADILEIFFDSINTTTAVHLHDSIVLRMNQINERPSGLIVIGYSTLIEPTAIGPRSIPLNRLDSLTDELYKMVVSIITSPPISDILKVSSYFPNKSQRVTLAYFDCPDATALAA